MEIYNNLVETFGLQPDITTFTDLITWFFGVMTAFLIITITIKSILFASWKLERSFK